jgi:hypothetical protein
MSPAAMLIFLSQETVWNYPSQQMRRSLFFPVGETDKTTSILFPQMLQRCTLFFASALDETSVFDFPFSAI